VINEKGNSLRLGVGVLEVPKGKEIL